MSKSSVICIRLSPRRIAAVAVLVSATSLLMLLGTYIDHGLSPEQPWRVQYIALQFNLGLENNAAAWYSSMLLVVVALAMATCFVLDMCAATDRRNRLLSFGWLLMAALFAALSLDELGSLHERINSVRFIEDMRNPLRVGVPGWVGILAIPVVLVCALLIAFGWLRLRQCRPAFGLMCAGLLLFASIPLQEAVELAGWSASDRRAAGPLLLEEGTELFAALCMLLSAMWYAHVTAAPAARREHVLTFSPRPDVLIGLELLLALGMLFVYIALPHIMDLQDTRGVTLNWFPAVMAFGIALTSAYLAAQGSSDHGWQTSGMWWLVAVLHLGLSIDHGSAHRFTEELLSGTPALRWGLDAALVIVIAAGAALLAHRARDMAARAAIAAWAVLLLAPVALEAERAWLSFAAYALLLPALMTMLPQRTAATNAAPVGTDAAQPAERALEETDAPRLGTPAA